MNPYTSPKSAVEKLDSTQAIKIYVRRTALVTFGLIAFVFSIGLAFYRVHYNAVGPSAFLILPIFSLIAFSPLIGHGFLLAGNISRVANNKAMLYRDTMIYSVVIAGAQAYWLVWFPFFLRLKFQISALIIIALISTVLLVGFYLAVNPSIHRKTLAAASDA